MTCILCQHLSLSAFGLLKNISAHSFSFAECLCFFSCKFSSEVPSWRSQRGSDRSSVKCSSLMIMAHSADASLYFSGNVLCTVTACLNFCNAASASMISAFTIGLLGWDFILYCYMLKAWQHWQMKKSSSFCNKLWYLNHMQVQTYIHLFTRDKDGRCFKNIYIFIMKHECELITMKALELTPSMCIR